MTEYLDFFNVYIIGCIQMLTGFYFLTKFYKRKVKLYFYLLFVIFGCAVIYITPDVIMADFFVYTLILIVSSVFLCNADWKSAFIYSALTVEIMQLCYGVVNSLLSILFPILSGFNQKVTGIIFMLLGNIALVFAALCYRLHNRYFSYDKTADNQYALLILTPILMIFCMGQYINSVIYGNVTVTDNVEITLYKNHYQLFFIQLLGIASLLCIIFAYKKLLDNFRLSTEISLLEQEERSLKQYVKEATNRYNKTKSFRHDIKNHITVVKELLQKGEGEQALKFIESLADITEELSFPCNTNNPVVDILTGNKFGLAKSMGIDVNCSMFLPNPCLIPDIDFCIILSNALDNAIHACKNLDENTKKYINITGCLQGDFILLEIENSFCGNGFHRRGTGLTNIKTIAEKYNGAISIKTQGKTFILSVLLIIPQENINDTAR